MRKAVLIVNPFATGVSEESLSAVRAELARHAEVEVLLTERPRHATELVESALRSECDGVFVFSGDGGFNEAVNGADGKVPFGFIPGGGTSVLPRALGLSRDPVETAHRLGEALEQGRTRRISLGRVNGRRFAFNAGVGGIDAETVRRFNALGRDPSGQRPGDARFALTLFGVLRDRRFRYEPVVELNGVGPVAFAVVSNCEIYTYVGPRAMSLTPRARFELGLDALAPRAVRPRDVLRLGAYVATGKEWLRGSSVEYVHDADRLELRSDVLVPLQADGEDLGDVQEVILECERSALSVLV
jgi:diacylglycerol kinase family enzyme